MYRINKDKRVVASAQKIIDALRKCLEKKSFNEIGVSDLAREAGISRATFYRLFDTPSDIFEYICDDFASNIVGEYKATSFRDQEEASKFILEHWMVNANVIETVMKCGRVWLLMRSMENHMRDLSPGLPGKFTPEEMDYVKAAAFAQMGAMLMVWVKHGKKEPVDMLIRLYRKIHSGNYA